MVRLLVRHYPSRGLMEQHPWANISFWAVGRLRASGQEEPRAPQLRAASTRG